MSRAFELFEQPPGLPFSNEQGIPQVPLAIHCATSVASAYEKDKLDIQGYLNWMRGHGRMKKLSMRFSALSLLGDTAWCKGVEKRIEGECHIAAL